jgi:indolepyruvate ferredoxin oxidoreductase
VARYLFKLMAYKDEYEVARLALLDAPNQALREQFGDEAKIAYHLHPPFLRALGWKKKIRFGRWFTVVYRLLAAMKGLRGTPFDPFGYAHVRRVERELIDEYRSLIGQALADVSPDGYARAVALAELPDVVRGYEQVKLESVQRYRAGIVKVRAGGAAG